MADIDHAEGAECRMIGARLITPIGYGQTLGSSSMERTGTTSRHAQLTLE
jgi:hypothetical protein